MPATAHHLALDLGASSGRAMLGTFDGQRLKIEELHRFPNEPLRSGAGYSWNIAQLFDEIRRALSICGTRGVRLDGLAIDTWGVDYGLLSAGGELLGRPRHYRDPRTRGLMEQALQRVSRDEFYARTGVQLMPFNTVFQLLADARDDPATLPAAQALLFMPDLLNSWLTGVRQSERTIASTSQLYDAVREEWAADLMQRLGLPAAIMPAVAPPGTVVGELRSEIAQEAGVRSVSVIAPASHDTASAVAAVPAVGSDWAYISSGTWSLVGIELPSPLRTAAALEAGFTNEAGACGTTCFLKNVPGLWLMQECQRIWASQAREVPTDRLTAMAEAVEPLAVLIDPEHSGFADFCDMPARICEYCTATGQRPPDSPGAIVRCILDSLALNYRMTLAALEHLTGRPIRVVHVVGGGSLNRLLCQLTADAVGRSVVAGPVEATAAGNILVQAMARGHLRSLEALRAVVSASFELTRFEPRPGVGWEEAESRLRARCTIPASGRI
ncbi:MAG TPA: rhamnulokinase family protein [Phycisphaerae bacterium]|jgi:rhamnulokinase